MLSQEQIKKVYIDVRYNVNCQTNIRQRDDKKMLENKKSYSIFKGIFYAIILYTLLWWLPVFGVMISGYVAGRKAGSPMKGIFAVLIPASAFIILIYILTKYPVVYVLHAQYLKNMIMFAYVSLGSLTSYVSNFEGFLHYIPDTLLIFVIFGYVGGILSQHIQDEANNSENRKIKEWNKHPEPLDNNFVEEIVEKPKVHPLIKKAVRQKHNEFKKRKKEEEPGIDTL